MSDIEKLAAEAIRKLGIAYPSTYAPEMVRLYAEARAKALDEIAERARKHNCEHGAECFISVIEVILYELKGKP